MTQTRMLASAVNANNISLVLLGANGRPMPYVVDKGHPHFPLHFICLLLISSIKKTYITT